MKGAMIMILAFVILEAVSCVKREVIAKHTENEVGWIEIKSTENCTFWVSDGLVSPIYACECEYGYSCSIAK